MVEIIPNIWCNDTADEAADFYVNVFPDSELLSKSSYPTEGLLDFQEPLAGKTVTAELSLWGHRFTLLNATGDFRPTPAISFMVNFDPAHDPAARSRIDEVWSKLAAEGTVFMELGEYAWSSRYGWVEDKFGVSWQLIFTDPDGEPRPAIMPALMFAGAAQNKASQAVEYYTELFDDAAIGMQVPYGAPTGPATAEALMFSDFTLAGQWFVANDSGEAQEWDFSEGVSLAIMCDTQDEIDRYWDGLSHVPKSEQCGWCKDQFGVSWQVSPAHIEQLLERPGAFERMLEMKKLVIDDF